MSNPLFALGRTLATPGALEVLARHNLTPLHFLQRHVTGDWSEMDVEDQASNRQAVECGSRVFSSFKLDANTRIWVITEWDRSSTTILLPMEY